MTGNPAKHARRPVRGRATALALTVALVAAAGTAALGAEGSLPGGTSLSVGIVDPADGLTIAVEDEADTVDLTVTGSASLAGTDAVKNTTLIYILDLSGSMTAGAGVDCTGNGSNDNRLVCQAEAVAFLNSLAANPASPVGWTGVGTYASGGSTHNVDLAPDGDRLLVPPTYDGNNNGIPDLEDVVRAFIAGGLTNFTAGLDQALTILARSTTPVNRIVYISDGQPNAGSNVNTYAGRFDAYGTTRIDSFAITSGSGCGLGSTQYGNLNDIATLGTQTGTCVEVKDLSDLNFVLGQVLSSELLSLEGSVNGGDAQAIVDVTPELPEDGPVTADFSWDVSDLAVGQHELCVTATGVDGGGEGDVTECVTVTVEVPAAPDGLSLAPSEASGAIGEEHTVTATLLDDEGDPITEAEISFEITDGPHAGATGTAETNTVGEASFTYEGTEVGTDTIVATYTPDEGDPLTSNTATMAWSEVLDEALYPPVPEETEEDDLVEVEAEAATPVQAQPDFTG